jgi:hypothetical protein
LPEKSPQRMLRAFFLARRAASADANGRMAVLCSRDIV